MNEIYKECMMLGHSFQQKYADLLETEDWTGTEECATVAELAYNLMNKLNLNAESALDIVMDTALSNGFRNVEDHGYDDYARGFLAGEILGVPNQENYELVKKAEQIWEEDDSYGYYQEILNDLNNSRDTQDISL